MDKKKIWSEKYLGSEKVMGKRKFCLKNISVTKEYLGPCSFDKKKVFWIGTIVTKTNVAYANDSVIVLFFLI